MELELSNIQDILAEKDHCFSQAFNDTIPDSFKFDLRKKALTEMYGWVVAFKGVVTQIKNIYQRTAFSLPCGQRLYQITIQGEQGGEIDGWGYKGGIFVDNLGLRAIKVSYQNQKKRMAEHPEDSNPVDLLIEGKLTYRDTSHVWQGRKKVTIPEDDLVVLVGAVSSLSL
tara:strand:- start:2611 stop:3120 length:510 start_codon:yes stop_codon:yes gene_type:complete